MKNKKLIITIVVVLIIIGVIIGVILMNNNGSNNDKTTKEETKGEVKEEVEETKTEENENNNETVDSNKSTSDIEKIEFVDNVYTEDNSLYYLDVSNLESEGEITYKLGDNFSVKLVSGGECKLYVNGKYVREDLAYCGNMYNYTVLNVINDTLIDTNHFGTDIRSLYFYIISKEGKITKELYQLEDIKGMVADKYSFEDGKLIIEGTRINHGPSIMYGEDVFGVYIYDEEEINKLDVNMYVKATYTYEFNQGNITLVSTKGTQTLSQYLDMVLNR